MSTQMFQLHINKRRLYKQKYFGVTDIRTKMNFIVESCRICLRKDDEMKPLTSNWNNSMNFLELLINFVNDTDNSYDASQSICYLCELLLISSYCFKKMCLETKTLLKSHEFVNKMPQTNARDADNFKDDPLNNPNWNHLEAILKTEENTEISIEPIDNKIDVVELNTLSDLVQKLNPENMKAKGRTCPACNIKFKNVREYQNHRIKFHVETVVCTICGKLKDKRMLKRHMDTHSNAKDHICPKCGKHFKHSEYLKGHLRIHTGEKRFTCKYCDRRFRHWATKRDHILKEHTIINENEKKFECHICDKKFYLSSALNRHIRGHRLGERKFECNNCEYKFFGRRELERHMVVHTGEKNVICEICNKAFGTRKTMRSHMKVHSGERNYMCVICKKTFTQVQNLRTHMKTHPDYPIPPRGTVLFQKVPNRNSDLTSNMMAKIL